MNSETNRNEEKPKEDPKVEESKKNNGKVTKKIKLIVGVIGTLLTIITSLILLPPFWESYGPTSVSIVETAILPWEKTNSYYADQNYVFATTAEDSEASFPRTSTILSKIENNKNKEIIISKAKLKINSVKRLEEPRFYSISSIVDNQLITYIINNNYGKEEELSYTVGLFDGYESASYSGGDMTEFLEFLDHIGKIELADIKDGEIRELLRIDIPDNIQEMFKERSGKPIWISISDNDFSEEKSYFPLAVLAIDYSDEEGLHIAGGGGGGGLLEEKDKILQMDVKNNNVSNEYELDFYKPIEAGGSEILETIVFPNESCEIDLSISYVLSSNKELTSEKLKNMKLSIYVPLYDINKSDMINKEIFFLINDYFEMKGITHYNYNDDFVFQKEIEYDSEDFEIVKLNEPL